MSPELDNIAADLWRYPWGLVFAQVTSAFRATEHSAVFPRPGRSLPHLAPDPVYLAVGMIWEAGIPIIYGSADHWMARAEEARAMAKNIQDADAKRAMLEIAENYEKIAKRAEAREIGIPTPGHKD